MVGEDMAPTDSTPYLGVTITKNLKWNQQVNIITVKDNKILGLLHWNKKTMGKKKEKKNSRLEAKSYA